jgi:hypothetical protein
LAACPNVIARICRPRVANSDDCSRIDRTRLESFTTSSGAAITTEVRLPTLQHSGAMAWPPLTPPLFLQMLPGLPSFRGADWPERREAHAQAYREEHKRVLAHYESNPNDKGTLRSA